MRSNKFDGDRAGIVAGNVSLLIEDNDLDRSREAAVHLFGAGAVVRGNRVSDGAAMGIVAENARDALAEKHEARTISRRAIMARGSPNVVDSRRIAFDHRRLRHSLRARRRGASRARPSTTRSLH